MKSTVFELKFPCPAPDRNKETDVMFPIPTLMAYAIEYAEFSCKGGLREHKEMVQGKDFDLVDDGLIWHGFFEPTFPGMDYYRLVIHYHGIRDYALLFPHIGNPSLQKRLGHFYEEAELCFENGAWLAFVLMCGALYEGLLLHHFGEQNKTLDQLINAGRAAEIINDEAARIMHSTRELRNLVHAGRAEEAYVQRAQAMDMRRVLDRLIKDAAYWQENATR